MKIDMRKCDACGDEYMGEDSPRHTIVDMGKINVRVSVEGVTKKGKSGGDVCPGCRLKALRGQIPASMLDSKKNAPPPKTGRGK